METPRLTCTLVMTGGPSRRVSATGVLIGREHDCDIVSEDPSVSRRHALVRLTTEGAELVPLGRAPVAINGEPRTRPHLLNDGDVIAIPGLTLTVSLTAHRPSRDGAAMFRLARTGGGSFGVLHSPFMIGGAPTDDLIVASWPARAMVLHVAQRELFVEIGEGEATRNGAAIPLGTLEPVAPGDRLGYRGEELVVVHTPAAAVTTAVSAPVGLPTRVNVEVLPRGGRVSFTLGGADHVVFLHDRRLDLLIALARPPAAYRAGDFIPDDAVGSIVWPRNDGVSRTDINVLIRRLRKDLVEAGLAGPRLIERAPGGGATRLALAPGARVDVEG